MEQVLEQGPWVIRNQPLILTKWSPNSTLSKDKITRVPIWVKIHKVLVVAYSAVRLSLIGTQIGRPILLDAFTSSMCKDPWGRIGYARALIEVSADMELKNEVTMAIPILDETKKRKGKKVKNGQPRHIEGLKLDKPKPKFAWSVKQKQIANAKTNSSEEAFVTKLKSSFTALQDEDEANY
nr:hypothetical protein [Tanacetum cinerariifolium]